MDKIQLCEKLRKTVRKLVLFDGQQITGFLGSGTIISPDGILLTANHVIAPISKLSNPRIVAYGIQDIPEMEYIPRLMNVSFSISTPELMKPLVIDLAILNPVGHIKNLSYLILKKELIQEGTEVLMAGFPDEVLPPLHFDKMINFASPELAKEREKAQVLLKAFMRLLMIKSGMVGNVQKINMSGTFQKSGGDLRVKFEGAEYWIDNVSNHGASGGPVVDLRGELIGVICEKGSTRHEQYEGLSLKVPSGATMALSHHLITWGLNL